MLQLRRKASPRELAEAFKGHGLRQADWAPVPIYWARPVGTGAPSRDEQKSIAAADQVCNFFYLLNWLTERCLLMLDPVCVLCWRVSIISLCKSNCLFC